MAYLEFASAGAAAMPERIAFAPRRFAPAASELTALEWAVVDLAQQDHLASVQRPGAVARFLRWLAGAPAKTSLSSPRLEALRRMAVLSWHYGYTVPGEDVRDFVAAGFTLDHYELLVDSISVARAARNRRAHR